MEMKIAEALVAREALDKLATKPYNAKLAYRIARMISKLDSELKTFEQKRIELIMKHGEKTEDGKYTIKPENMELFSKTLNELLSETITIDRLPLPLAMFEDNPLEAADIMKLGALIGEEDA